MLDWTKIINTLAMIEDIRWMRTIVTATQLPWLKASIIQM